MRAVASSWFSRGPQTSVVPDTAFYVLAGRLVRWCAVLAAALLLAALALAAAPSEGDRRDAVRILFVHVPAAWTSIALYLALTACAARALTTTTRTPSLLMRALAPTGAMFTLLALWTGSLLGGQAVWVWKWDARLTCELILFLIYAAVLGLRPLMADAARADRASAVLVLVGALNLPIIYFSLAWWDTMHRGLTVRLANPAAGAFHGMLLFALAFTSYAVAVVLARARSMLRESDEADDIADAEGA